MPAISDLLDSDMEGNDNFVDENSLISSISDTSSIAQSKAAAAKKPRKRKCVTMPKKARAPKVVVKADPEISAPIAGTKRKARPAETATDEGDLQETEAVKSKAAKSKPLKVQDATTANIKATKGRSTKKVAAAEEDVLEDALPSPVVMRSNFATVQSLKRLPKPVMEGKSKASTAKAHKVTTRMVEDVVSDLEDEDFEVTEAQPARKKARTESRVRQEPSYRRRAGSVSDTERGDPLLRRKLGDITRKFENVDAKFKSLKEVAVSEANTNFEKLRREHDTIIETTNKLVSSLKQQLAQQAPIIQEYQKSKKDSQQEESKTKKLQAAHDDLSASLTAAQNEIKSLKAKLTAAKATPTPLPVPAPAAVPTEAKVPASTHKNIVHSNKAGALASSETTQKQQLKLDLYSDLTGLIIRDVKQTEDGDTFDCIQTGRDGRALHFKLFIDSEDTKKSNRDEQEVLYTPLLDAGRDRELIEIMPSYLTEDITFTREVSAKFYGRVVETVMRKQETESGEEETE